jgi:hypothetical protein
VTKGVGIVSAVETQGSLLALPEPSETLDLVPSGRLGDLFTRRLRRLIGIRRDHGNRMNEQGLRLLDRAIYSTYCDCLDLGVGDEGLRILHA